MKWELSGEGSVSRKDWSLRWLVLESVMAFVRRGGRGERKRASSGKHGDGERNRRRREGVMQSPFGYDETTIVSGIYDI